MYYNENLEKIVIDRKNPVNRMYLHEILLKWKNFEKMAENPMETSNEDLVKALNEFIRAVSNKKYKFNSSSKNGFKPGSHIYSARYLDDLITVLIQRTKIFDNIGISWGYQSFSANLKFNPSNLCTMSNNPMFEFDHSAKVLALAQKLDFQFRISGKRRFNKHLLVYPLITFYTFKNLTEDDFITIEYYATQAKTTFEKSRSIIITETMDNNFKPDLQSSPFDAIFILRKQYRAASMNDIQLDVVNSLEKRIRMYCTETQANGINFTKTGVIESYKGDK